MHAAIYARTCRREKLHHTTSIPNQVAFCHELVARHGLAVDVDHVFTDVEYPGSLFPSCWALEGEPSRPALSALVNTIEAGIISHVAIRRFEKFGTSSEVLLALLELFQRRDVWILATREQLRDAIDPTGAFAYSILKSRVRFDNAAERDSKLKEIARRREEIARLGARMARLEFEITELEA